MESELCCLWQAGDQGAVLLCVLGETPCPVLPQALGGMPLTEIGPYCFSPRTSLCQGAVLADADGETHTFSSLEAAQAAFSLPVLSGDFVECVTLPKGVLLLHNAAFYNCRRMKTLSVGAGIKRIGSDCFTNCRSLHSLVLRTKPDSSSGLAKLTGSISAAVSAEFQYHEKIAARLYFPEYADDNPENGPAHIFMHSFQGAGYPFRQCFGLDGCVKFGEYDRCFVQAIPIETPEVLTQIALGRLQYPVGLSAEADRRYRGFCRQHPDALFGWLLRERDLCSLAFACREQLFSARAIADASMLASRLGLPQAAALLLNSTGQPHRKTGKYDFDP